MIAAFRWRIADSRTVLAVVIAAIAAVTLSAQKPDRSRPPAIGPAPSLKLPAIQKQKLSNGLGVWIVEHHEVPLAQVNLIVRSGSAADPIGKLAASPLPCSTKAPARDRRSTSPTRSSSSARISRR
jgi:hypothetical protein